MMFPLYIVLAHSILSISADNLALLSNSLKTFQSTTCDGQLTILRCPPQTSIMVQGAQYGKGNGTCSHPHSQGHTRWNATCTWPSALQYSLLQSVVEACHKRRLCRFHATPSPDPCPWLKNFVEVIYKCRPNEFKTKVSCEGDLLGLSCGAHSRVAIYSASYGRTEYESVTCPQPPGIPEETCLGMYTTETVMRVCHGRRHCSLVADTATLGNPCSRHSRVYLKVVYTCAPRIVIKDFYDFGTESDEVAEVHYDYDESTVDSELYGEWPNLAGRRENYTTAVPLTPASPHARRRNSRERHEDVLYALLALSIVVIAVLGVSTSYLLWQRRGFVKPSGERCSVDTGMDLINISPNPASTRTQCHEILTFVGEENLDGTNIHHYIG